MNPILLTLAAVGGLSVVSTICLLVGLLLNKWDDDQTVNDESTILKTSELQELNADRNWLALQNESLERENELLSAWVASYVETLLREEGLS